MARAISAAIWRWLARNELASAAVTLIISVNRPLLAHRLVHDSLGRHQQLAPARDDGHLVGQEAGADEAAAVVAQSVFENAGISVAGIRWTLTHHAALVEEAEAAAGERPLQQPGDLRRDRLAHCYPRDVAEDAVRQAFVLQPAETDADGTVIFFEWTEISTFKTPSQVSTEGNVKSCVSGGRG